MSGSFKKQLAIFGFAGLMLAISGLVVYAGTTGTPLEGLPDVPGFGGDDTTTTTLTETATATATATATPTATATATTTAAPQTTRGRDPDDPGPTQYTVGSDTRIDSEVVASRLELAIGTARRDAGLGGLRTGTYMASVARAHSADMAEREYVSTVSPDGETPRDRFGTDRAAELCSGGYSEVVQRVTIDADGGPRTVASTGELVDAVMNRTLADDETRSVVLEPDATHAGVGVYLEPLFGEGKAQAYVTVDVCTRASE